MPNHLTTHSIVHLVELVQEIENKKLKKQPRGGQKSERELRGTFLKATTDCWNDGGWPPVRSFSGKVPEEEQIQKQKAKLSKTVILTFWTRKFWYLQYVLGYEILMKHHHRHCLYLPIHPSTHFSPQKIILFVSSSPPFTTLYIHGNCRRTCNRIRHVKLHSV